MPTPPAARRRLRHLGFTLIELIVVIVILGILVAVGAFAYNSVINGSRQDAVAKTAAQVASTIQGDSATHSTPTMTDSYTTAQVTDLVADDLPSEDSVAVTSAAGDPLQVTVSDADGRTAIIDFPGGVGDAGTVRHGDGHQPPPYAGPTFHTDPHNPDTDGDRRWDGDESIVHGDPAVADQYTDTDGLPDAYELTIGTDPTKWDTDGDHCYDHAEVIWGFDPTTAMVDSDGDCLADDYESAHGLNPTLANDDGDVFAAVDELFWMGPECHTDPLVYDADTDGDGLADVVETRLGTDPNRADTDGDGQVDSNEACTYYDPFRDPLVAEVDSDGDMIPDVAELGVN